MVLTWTSSLFRRLSTVHLFNSYLGWLFCEVFIHMFYHCFVGRQAFPFCLSLHLGIFWLRSVINFNSVNFPIFIYIFAFWVLFSSSFSFSKIIEIFYIFNLSLWFPYLHLFSLLFIFVYAFLCRCCPYGKEMIIIASFIEQPILSSLICSVIPVIY